MFRALPAFLLFLSSAGAQHVHDMAHMNMGNTSTAGDLLMMQASGTSMNPQSWPMPMLMLSPDGWNLMFMGQAFLVDTQQTGPRGADKFYSANWGMFAAEHRVGEGSFMFQMMLSLDPATITDRRFPE